MKKVLALTHDKYEDLELWYPVLRLREEGYTVTVVSEEEGKIYHGKWGYPVKSDAGFNDIDYKDYDGIIVPGGFAPDKLRRFQRVLDMIRYFDEFGKPIGQICHAGWVLISSKILKGRKCTSYIAIKDDMENAGGIWLDEKIVTDRNLISAQSPADLPSFMKEFIKLLK